MGREFNSPKEMIMRLAFIVYLGGMAMTFLLGIIGLAKMRFPLLAGCAIACFVTIALKRYGVQHLEFRRLLKSFPYGTPEDDIPPHIRAEVDSLFIGLAEKNIEWTRRHELRQRLAALIEKEPGVREAYREEIFSVMPSMAKKHLD